MYYYSCTSQNLSPLAKYHFVILQPKLQKTSPLLEPNAQQLSTNLSHYVKDRSSTANRRKLNYLFIQEFWNDMKHTAIHWQIKNNQTYLGPAWPKCLLKCLLKCPLKCPFKCLFWIMHPTSTRGGQNPQFFLEGYRDSRWVTIYLQIGRLCPQVP